MNHQILKYMKNLKPHCFVRPSVDYIRLDTAALNYLQNDPNCFLNHLFFDDNGGLIVNSVQEYLHPAGIFHGSIKHAANPFQNAEYQQILWYPLDSIPIFVYQSLFRSS